MLCFFESRCQDEFEGMNLFLQQLLDIKINEVVVLVGRKITS